MSLDVLTLIGSLPEPLRPWAAARLVNPVHEDPIEARQVVLANLAKLRRQNARAQLTSRRGAPAAVDVITEGARWSGFDGLSDKARDFIARYSAARAKGGLDAFRATEHPKAVAWVEDWHARWSAEMDQIRGGER